MGLAVNLVVSCSNRKRYETAPEARRRRKLAGSGGEQRRLRAWRETPKTTVPGGQAPGPRPLHGGALVRRPQYPGGSESTVWLGASGSGSVRPATVSSGRERKIRSYQATFARGTEGLRCPWNARGFQAPIQSLVGRAPAPMIFSKSEHSFPTLARRPRPGLSANATW
jgi:hypothetical protein